MRRPGRRQQRLRWRQHRTRVHRIRTSPLIVSARRAHGRPSGRCEGEKKIESGLDPLPLGEVSSRPLLLGI